MFAHVDDIAVEARVEASGFNRHRATTAVCADIMALERFVEDIDQFPEWVHDTLAVEVLEQEEGRVSYYVKTAAPWPFKPRDMIYELRLEPDVAPEEIVIHVTGMPDALPPRDGAVRMAAADGEWRLRDLGRAVEVSFSLYVDAGKVPRYFANRRASRGLGKTLSNLRRAFPCTDTVASSN